VDISSGAGAGEAVSEIPATALVGLEVEFFLGLGRGNWRVRLVHNWADNLAMELIAGRKLTGCEFFDIAIPFADREWWMEVRDPFLRPLVMDTGCFLLSTGAWNEVKRSFD
jgi:hypothetical protein